MAKKKILNQEGICPKCGDVGNLNYDTVEVYEGGIYYPYDCPKCEFQGREYYSTVFDTHTDLQHNDFGSKEFGK